jgi:hypothetical protein
MKTVQSRKDIFFTVTWIFFLAIVVLWLNLSWNPTLKGIGSDSGVYAYIGSAIIHGQIPYRDVWEQKPPVGLYLNALAVFLFGRNLWAIWWFNLIWITLSAAVFFLVLRKMMGLLVGCMASILFVLGAMEPSIFQGGNLMEIYGFLPQILIIGCTYYFFTTQRNLWVFWGGVLTGIAFLTKQTTIALGASSLVAIEMITLLRREHKDLWARPAIFFSGFMLPIGIATSYWLAIGAVKEYLAGVFLYSLSYVGLQVSFLWSIKHTFVSVFPAMFISKIYFIAAISFLLYLVENLRWFLNRIISLLKTKSAILSDSISPVGLTLLAVFIALPLEIVLASLGARNYGHYFLSLLPAVTVAVAYIFAKAITILRIPQFGKKDPRAWLAVGGGILALASLAWMLGAVAEEAPTSKILASFPKVLFDYPDPGNDVASYVDEMTTPNDPVLVWNAHATIYFLADRKPPQRVLSATYIISSGPTGGSKSNLAEFLDEFEANPPRLIVVQKVSSIGLPFINVPVEKMCPHGGCIPEVAEGMQHPDTIAHLQEFRQYFLEHYTLDTNLGDLLIYKRTY